jgi:hypothetical protein
LPLPSYCIAHFAIRESIRAMVSPPEGRKRIPPLLSPLLLSWCGDNRDTRSQQYRHTESAVVWTI